MSLNNLEYSIHNREDSPYNVSKPCVKLLKYFKFNTILNYIFGEKKNLQTLPTQVMA
jgi:hypothetical protein